MIRLTPERAQAEWYHLATIQERSTEQTLVAVLSTANGQNHLVAGALPSTPRSDAPPLASQAPSTARAASMTKAKSAVAELRPSI
jgi:alkaline phosphatase D